MQTSQKFKLCSRIVKWHQTGTGWDVDLFFNESEFDYTQWGARGKKSRSNADRFEMRQRFYYSLSPRCDRRVDLPNGTQYVSTSISSILKKRLFSEVMMQKNLRVKLVHAGHVWVNTFTFCCAAGTSRASGGGRRGKRGMRWTTRGRGTCWPVTATPPPWPSLTSDSMWSAGRRFYIGKLPFHKFLDCRTSLSPLIPCLDSPAMRCS